MPILTLEKTPLCGVWKIEESSEMLRSMLSRSDWYCPFLEQHIMEHRRVEWLAVRVLLRIMLGREARIDYLANGSPFLPDESLHISISHTKGYAAVLLSEHPFPGIDIEYRSERVCKISSRFMSANEQQHLNSAQQVTHLLLHWSAKETLFKALGQQDVDFRKQLHINPFLPAAAGTFTGYETRTPQEKAYTLHYRVTDEYVLTYYSAIPNLPAGKSL